ncbi:hypothetical protein ACFRJ8_14775 [Arthrobacter sp. NPDC056886]|uniref:hypothetical protein n=1 Tax=Arthrobacter sp. NPDC056886 TaxID=3345960 RepID=UPI00366F13DC
MIPDAAVAHYKQMQSLQGLVVMAAADLWSEVGVADLTGSWARQIPAMASVLSAVQLKAATAGASYGAATLAAQGLYEAPEHFVDPRAFAGAASDGRTLAGLLYSPVPHTKALIAGGMDPRMALEAGGRHLTTLTRTQVADAGRGAAGVDVATRKNTGFVRMLNPPSCSRCSVLAGKFYRWNNGFDRHPKCDCVHVQTSVEAAQTEGLMHDPYEYFHSLSQADQDKAYTKAGAQAIRDGGDLFQVVNSRRGMKPGGLVTTEGATRRGNFGNTRGPRLTPEAIYGKGLGRAETLRELERYGYILPGGQNPLGVIRGQAEGFGQLGHGGTRVGAREAVLRARETGVRDPLSRATMTAAERRSFDAQANWDAVQAGRNPFTNRKGAKVTPEVAARVEMAYRKELARTVESRAPRAVITTAPKTIQTPLDAGLNAITSAKTTQEVGEALASYSSASGRGFSVGGFDDGKVSISAAKEVALTAAKLAEKYPEAEFSGVYFGELRGNVAGNTLGGVVRINNANALNDAARARATGFAVRSGHHHSHDADQGLTYTMTHEFGHVIDNMTNHATRDDLTKIKAGLRSELKVKVNSPEWRKQVSTYGASDNAELIAEAFVDVEINGASATELSKRIHARLVKNLRAK